MTTQVPLRSPVARLLAKRNRKLSEVGSVSDSGSDSVSSFCQNDSFLIHKQKRYDFVIYTAIDLTLRVTVSIKISKLQWRLQIKG